MTKRTAKSYFKGSNFLTPDVIDRGFKGRYVYELSSGDFLGKPLYGVTLADRETGDSLYDESRSFDALVAARSYIANLAQ